MNHSIFEQLNITPPDADPGVGSGSHGHQAANIMQQFEAELANRPAAAVIVVGDANSTLACALVAAKMAIPVIPIEVGLRCFDRTRAEEINRILTAQISDLLFTTERQAGANLQREGIDAARIRFVTNVMIDTLLQRCLPQAPRPEEVLRQFEPPADFLGEGGGFGLPTLHRPANVDDPAVFEGSVRVLPSINERTPPVFSVPPRSPTRLAQSALEKRLQGARILCLPPLGYLEMLGLMSTAQMVLTDSGGIQEESMVLGTPCLTMRENTERSITVDRGTHTLVGSNPVAILEAAARIAAGEGKTGAIWEYWHGQAAGCIAEHLRSWLRGRAANV